MSHEEKTSSRRGLAGMAPEKAAAAREKSLETRRRNKLQRDETLEKAKELRAQATAFINRAEKLNMEADELDGQCSSAKAKSLRAAEISEEIIATFKDSVSPQYLKQMVSYAISRNLRAHQCTTPTYIAMDIINSPETSKKEKADANKQLMQIEISKPKMLEDSEGDYVGSVEEEMGALMLALENASPKR